MEFDCATPLKVGAVKLHLRRSYVGFVAHHCGSVAQSYSIWCAVHRYLYLTLLWINLNTMKKNSRHFPIYRIFDPFSICTMQSMSLP